jgi:hypothetical protein
MSFSSDKTLCQYINYNVYLILTPDPEEELDALDARKRSVINKDV